MRYAVIHTLAIGSIKHHVIESFIENVPDEAKPDSIIAAIQESSLASGFSEHGIFFANRKLIAEAKIPAKATGGESAKAVAWKLLSGKEMVQRNIRVTAAEQSAWDMAAKRSGLNLREWIRDTLNNAAKAS